MTKHIIYIYILKVKPSVNIKFRVLITYERVSYNEEGNGYYELKPNWLII